MRRQNGTRRGLEKAEYKEDKGNRKWTYDEFFVSNEYREDFDIAAVVECVKRRSEILFKL